ncbi:ATP-grasp domain-containing protein [Geobacter pelophilus]|uniref:ATP-grasp domain-containing protein n=1 Tax=Geoanaerobacter pelophilus TaxID=60036 RepID=A0AAW4L857_9BACT|nr:ATP-grasp domain-containing protein [Geoanaerobacter pelophilus]MBT0663401.1 ATP-grasp domain-containing protein [Geoanaerobacter pelophilus]
MNQVNVLVFPCGSEIGLEIYNSLKYSIHVSLYGASSVVSNHGKYVYDNYTDGLPYVDSPEFLDRINALIDGNKIDYVFPAHDSVLLKLSNERQGLHAHLITSPQETCAICRSKKATYEKFNALLPVPTVYTMDAIDSILPVFMKPDVGQGSKGTHLAVSRGEAEFYLAKDPTLLMLEYLPGKEYTVDCFSDRNGTLRFAGARERIRISNGISVDTKPIVNDTFKRLATIINDNLCFRGAWFFQVKENWAGDLTLLEVAPRIAGSMGLYRSLGVNFALLSLFDAQGLDVDIMINSYGIEMDRALANRYHTDLKFEHVYIDLDDCIIKGGRVNPLIVAFLYQCIADSIKIHLITRHNGELKATLVQYRLDALFDTITHLNREDLKSSYLKERNAIFIDDSFSERREINKALGIPVFAPDALECLMKW